MITQLIKTGLVSLIVFGLAGPALVMPAEATGSGQLNPVRLGQFELKVFDEPGTATQEVCGQREDSLLGFLPTWDRGLTDCENLDSSWDEFDPNGKVNIIITNITNILVTLAGVVAVGFVIFGGFKLVISDGDQNKIVGARKTIIHALVGVVVAVVAKAVIESIIYPRITTTTLDGPLPELDLTKLIGFVFLMLGFVATLMILLQGIKYSLSKGQPEPTSKARNGLINAAVGSVVAFSAWALVDVVLGRIALDGIDEPAGIFSSVIGILAFVAGIIAVIMVIVGGFTFVNSGGDTDKTTRARQTMIYALVGLLVTIFGAVLLDAVLARFV